MQWLVHGGCRVAARPDILVWLSPEGYRVAAGCDKPVEMTALLPEDCLIVAKRDRPVVKEGPALGGSWAAVRPDKWVAGNQ